MSSINIHFILEGEGLNYCQEINAGIRDITPSPIAFSENSSQIPHISLVRCELQESASLEEVAEVVRQVVGEYEPVSLQLLSPSLDKSSGYILLDVEGGKALEALKSALHRKLMPMIHSPSNTTDNPHVTLAYIENKQDAVEDYLYSVRTNITFLSPGVEISNEGERGTCINSLYQFKFSEA